MGTEIHGNRSGAPVQISLIVAFFNVVNRLPGALFIVENHLPYFTMTAELNEVFLMTLHSFQSYTCDTCMCDLQIDPDTSSKFCVLGSKYQTSKARGIRSETTAVTSTTYVSAQW